MEAWMKGRWSILAAKALIALAALAVLMSCSPG
jgi:hypothetical protein